MCAKEGKRYSEGFSGMEINLPLAVVADEGVKLNADRGKPKPRSSQTVRTDAVFWEFPQLIQQLLRLFLAPHLPLLPVQAET